MTWVANCNYYINLRKYPGGPSLAQIPNGEDLELLAWYGQFARVCYNGVLGYVRADYLKPADCGYYDTALDTVMLTSIYSYEQLMTDAQSLAQRYPDLLSIETIGYSELGREIPVIRIGDAEAEYHVLFHGAIHAREHMTSWLLMAMTDYWVDHNIGRYANVCFHIIPMVNPDGVVISQTGVLTEEQREIYLRDRRLGYTYLSEAAYAATWKANGVGVDLNRNFPAGWEQIDDRTAASSQMYKGEAAFCAAEAQVLRDYTLRFPFDATVSYHATGSLIYYEYGDNTEIISQSASLGNAVDTVSGYKLQDSDEVGVAGYKDWVMDTLEIPSITIEIGCDPAPLVQRELYSIFVRNYRVLTAVADWVQGEE